MYEFLVVAGAIAFLYWLITRKKVRPIAVSKVSYDNEGNVVKLTLKNNKPICYKYKAAIRFKDFKEPVVATGMAAAQTSGRPQFMLLAENEFPLTIGPNETIEITLPPVIPKEMITDGAHQNLYVELKFMKYEDMLANGITESIPAPAIPEIPQAPPEPEKAEPISMPLIEPITEIPPTPIVEPTTIEIAPPITAEPKLIVEPETIISIVPENLHKADDIIANFNEEDLYSDSLKNAGISINERNSGRCIGQSQTMLQIMLMMERIKGMGSGPVITDSDAI